MAAFVQQGSTQYTVTLCIDHVHVLCCVLQVSRFVRLDIDPKNVMWRRVVDINDRWGDRRLQMC
jgi:formyltetrahydrofolate synthetase